MNYVPPPPRALGPVTSDIREVVLAALRKCPETPSQEAMEWAEKLRRFTSLYGRNLRSVAYSRLGSLAEDHLIWMAQVLVTASIHSPYRKGAPHDGAMLNGALFACSALSEPHPIQKEVDQATAQLAHWLEKADAQAPLYESMGAELAIEPNIWRSEKRVAFQPIVLICPSPFSLFSLATLELSLRLGLPIKAVVVRKFSAKRFFQELRRDGGKLLFYRIWRKLVVKKDENKDKTPVSLYQLIEALKPNSRDITKISQAHSIPILYVNEFHEANVELKNIAPGLGLFTGGGLIGEGFLSCFSQGIINVHMGHLPQFKGMDVVQAPILEGCFDHVGLTAHFMEPSLDAGPVLARYTLDTKSWPTLGAYRNVLSAIMPLLLIDCVLGVSSGRFVPKIQPQQGRQYYFIHPKFASIVDQLFSCRFDPQACRKPHPAQDLVANAVGAVSAFSKVS